MLFVFGYGDLFVFFIFLLTIVLLVRWRRPTDYPPGPNPLPLIGNFHNLITDDPLELFRGFRQKYGDIYSLALGNYWMVVINGIENLKELLVRQGRKTVERPDLFQFRVFRNKGVISNSGPSWEHNRAFTLTCLKDLGFGRKSFEDNIRDEIKIFLQRIKETDQAPFDIASGIHTSISNVIMSITVGNRYKYDDPEFTKFIKLLDENLKDPCLKGPFNFVPSLANIPGDIFGTKKIQSKINNMFNFFKLEIDHHKQTFDETHIRDFIDAFLLEMKRRGRSNTLFTEEQLLIIIGDLFSAGTETSATTIAWALLYLLHKSTFY